MATANQIANVFRLLNLRVPGQARLRDIANSGRSVGEVRDDLLQFLANRDGVSVNRALRQVLRQTFRQADVPIGTAGESANARVGRIAGEILRGDRTLGEVTRTIQSFTPTPQRRRQRRRQQPSPLTPAPPRQPPPSPRAAPEPPTPTPPRQPPRRTQPPTQPRGRRPPPPEPINWRAKARALFPWMPDALIGLFVNDPDFGWATTGNAELALAGVRASDQYDRFFPGNRRDDGSLRLSEQDYFSTREAYGSLFREFGLNSGVFENRFARLIEGEVSPSELAGRLGAVFEGIQNNLPEVAEEFAGFFGPNSRQALFASAIDPDLGQAILDRRISVAQVAGEAAARGFDIGRGFAGRLVSGGVGQEQARNLFIAAEGQLQTLSQLAARHRDPDDTFDLVEFAEANVFGDAEQTRRIRRLLRAEASLFTDQLGFVATSEDLVLTGLTPR